MDTEAANALTQAEWLAERSALQQRVAKLEAQVQQAQASVGKQLRFTEALLAAIPTPVFFKDAQGRYLGCNDAFTEQMGVTAAEIRGKTVYELWPSEHAVVYHQKDLELLQHPEQQIYDFKVRDKNGQERDVIFAKNVFYDKEGHVAGLVGAYVDITERKQAEEALCASEARYRALIEHSNDAIYVLYDGRFELINQCFIALFGVTPEEARAPDFDFMSLVAPKSRPLIEARQKQLADGQEIPSRYEFTALNRAGEEIEVEVSVSHIAYREGFATQGILRDISERKRAAEALARSEQRFRELIELAVDGILLGSPEGVITGANSRMLALLDIDKEALLGKHVREIFAPHSLQENPLRFDLLARGETVITERVIQRTDGTHVYIEMHSKQMPDGSYQSIVHDINERKQAEEALRESRAMLNLILDTVPQAIFWKDRKGHYLGCNKTFALAVGLEDPAHIVGKTDFDLPWTDEEAEAYRAVDREVLEHNRPKRHIIEPLQQADGSRLWINTTKVPLGNKNGEPFAVLGVYEDITERKRIEDALRLQSLVLDQIMDHVTVTNLNGVITYVNQAEAETFQRPKQEIIGQPTDIYGEDPERGATQRRIVEETLRNGFWRGEVVNYAVDGSEHTMDCRTQVIYDEHETPVAFCGIATDITERKRAEEAVLLKQKELTNQINLFEALLRNLRVGVFMVEVPTGKPILANDKALHLLGKGIVSDARTKQLAEVYQAYKLPERTIYPTNELPIVLGMQGISATVDDMLVIRPDGTEIQLEVFGTPVRDVQGRIWASLISFADITERKQAETALRFERAQLLSIFDSIDELIYVSDPHSYEILFVNQKLRDVLGKDAVGSICYQKFQGLDAPCPFCTNALILQNKPTPYRWEHHNPALDRDFTIVDRIITWPDGRDVRFELAVDITDRKALETQLRRHEQLAAIGQLAAGIAHDFRNLLTTIILYAQLGQRRPDIPPAVTPYLTTIVGEARKATDLVQQILDFARRAEIERRPLDLIAFVGKVVSVLQRTLPENIHFIFDVGAGDCVIEGDAGRLQQALTNLALNARDAMLEGGTLRIGLTRMTVAPDAAPPVPAMVQAATPRSWIYLSVADTGTGMSEEAYAHRFEPFFTTKEPEQGTGLGLAQVYGIIQLHNGHIDVTTEQGKGTTFNIYLPAATTITEEMGLTVAPIPLGHGETLLLVEDNAQLREAGRNLLTDLGYRVLTAANGEEALALYQMESDIALLLTDLVMPEMGGKALVGALHSHNPHLRALVMTGYTAEESESELRAAGFLEVIRKPLDAEHLARAIRRVLEAR